MVFPKRNRAGIWSFLYYRERWYFFFLKIWSYPLDGKWNMIFLKKYTELWYFFQTFWEDGLFKRGCAATWSFLHYLKRWYFLPENRIFFLWAESERWPFSRNTWKYDIFCVHVRVLQTWRHAPLSKKSKTVLSHKNTLKDDRRSRFTL